MILGLIFLICIKIVSTFYNMYVLFLCKNIAEIWLCDFLTYV